MASKEILLVTQEEYDKVLTNLKKKGEAYVRSYLIRSGASVSWVESLSKEDAFTHALVLKGALKERLPFKKAEVQKEKSGDAMEMFLQLMKSQEAERKEKNLKEEARIAKEEAEKRRGLQKRKRRERRGLQKKKEK